MSSGFGINGGRGRCFSFWQEFAKCQLQAETVEECSFQFEDYQECLFHKKEVYCSNVACKIKVHTGRVRKANQIKINFFNYTSN